LEPDDLEPTSSDQMSGTSEPDDGAPEPDICHQTSSAANPLTGNGPDVPDVPDVHLHTRSKELCDHCGGPATPANQLHPWDWPGRPDGIWLHRGCEAPWFETDGGSSVASVPFMLTRRMKQRLRERGMSDDEIAHITPQRAHEILDGAGGQP
jgi:hypothetical protein